MKLFKKNKIKNAAKSSKTIETKPARITNKTIEQHRREILDGAKKFKYPVQYEKHRLVINAILVGIVAVLLFFAVVLWQIYRTDNTSAFLYKISQIIPFEIGKIDNQPILLSDYLAYYRSSWHYYETKEQKNTDAQLEQKLQTEYKQQAFDNAAKIAYAKKLAKEKNITVTSAEVEEDLRHKLTYSDLKLSVNSFDKIVKEYYGLNQWEYRRVFIQYPLLLKKVMMAVDDEATDLEREISTAIKAADGKLELAALATQYKDRGVELIDSGVVKYKINDSGRSEIAVKLELGQISDSFVVRTLDGYNFIQLISKDEETLHYHVLIIPLKKFDQQLEQLISNQEIEKYIKIKE